MERDRLQAERDELRENNNELADQIKIGNNSRFVFWYTLPTMIFLLKSTIPLPKILQNKVFWNKMEF